jgi:hypothetical protein
MKKGILIPLILLILLGVIIAIIVLRPRRLTSEEILLRSLEKMERLESFNATLFAISETTYGATKTEMNQTMLVVSKGERSKVITELLYPSFPAPLEATYYFLPEGTFICLYHEKNHTCIEAPEAWKQVITPTPRESIEAIKRFMEEKVISEVEYFGKEEMIGRKCERLRVVTNTTKMIEKNLTQFPLPALDRKIFKNMSTITELCLDEEFGYSLLTHVKVKVSDELAFSHQVKMSAVEFNPNVDVLDEEFTLPAEPISIEEMEKRIRKKMMEEIEIPFIKIAGVICNQTGAWIYVQNVGAANIPATDAVVEIAEWEGEEIAKVNISFLPTKVDSISGPYEAKAKLTSGKLYSIRVVLPQGVEATDVCKAR